jgi:gamma-glutamylcyclotransferase
VVYDLALESKNLLDEIEGVGKGYESVMYDIAGYGECFAYVAQAPYIDNNIAPYEWYKQLVLEGCRFHSFPTEYIKMVESFDSIPDQNQLRAKDNFRLIKG